MQTDTSARWVAFPTTTDQQWHRVDERSTGVYMVFTCCGMQAQYPNRAVVFQHPSQPRIGFPECGECKHG